MATTGTSGPTHDRGATDGADDETTPLLTKAQRFGSRDRLRRHLAEDIDNRWADLLLLLSYVITGLLDSSAVFIWGSFVSMQTGNTVYLGLGLVEPTQGTRWNRSLTSIGFFCLGSFCFSRFHRRFSPKRRWVLLVSFLAQLTLIVVAAVVVVLDAESVDQLRWQVLVPLALVAFQSSGQAVTSRALQYNSLTSVVLTSIYCDLFSDPLILARLNDNAERNRRATAPLLLLVGAVLGGLWSHSPIGLTGALFTAALLKTFIILAFFFWRADSRSRRH